jgi:hypothetical protein
MIYKYICTFSLSECGCGLRASFSKPKEEAPRVQAAIAARTLAFSEDLSELD